jgi:hypothetical protein
MFFSQKCETLHCLIHMVIFFKQFIVILDSCNIYTLLQFPCSTTHVALPHSSYALWVTDRKKYDQAYSFASEENFSSAKDNTVVAHDYTLHSVRFDSYRTFFLLQIALDYAPHYPHVCNLQCQLFSRHNS